MNLLTIARRIEKKNMCSIKVNRARPSTLVEQIVFDKNTMNPCVSTRGCNSDKTLLLIKFFARIIKNEQTVLDDDSGEANKENIDPNRKYGGSNIWAFCWLL